MVNNKNKTKRTDEHTFYINKKVAKIRLINIYKNSIGNM